jgi:hypothetical protein
MYTLIQQEDLHRHTPMLAAPAPTSRKDSVTESLFTPPSSPLSPSTTLGATADKPSESWEQHPEMWDFALQLYHCSHIPVPAQVHELVWQTVPLEQGSLLARDIRTPFRTLRNKSASSPFLYAYCCFSEIKDESTYYSSREFNSVKRCYANTIGMFHENTKLEQTK